MWADFLRALALLMVLEGVLPFLCPSGFRSSLLEAAKMSDRGFRILGGVSMLAGLLLLQGLK
ncbi:MAG: DUF2065 domain-containing protein [Panacagrimonas sp.]